MNKVLLIGRLTRDPESRSTTSGNTAVNFTVAVNLPINNTLFIFLTPHLT